VDFTETASEVVNWFQLFQDKMIGFMNTAIMFLIKLGNSFTSFATVSFSRETHKSTSVIS